MTGLAFCLLLQTAAVGADALPYNDAYRAAQESDQPLVVLVGAEWCPGCVTMKRSVIPNLLRRGKLRNVQFAVVDTDDNPALAQKLMRGASIPQLIVFSRGEEGWKREQFTGPQAEATVEAAVDRAATAQAKAPKVADVR